MAYVVPRRGLLKQPTLGYHTAHDILRVLWGPGEIYVHPFVHPQFRRLLPRYAALFLSFRALFAHPRGGGPHS